MSQVIAAAVAHPFIAAGIAAAAAGTATTMASAMDTDIPEVSSISTVQDTISKSKEQATLAAQQRRKASRRSRSIFTSPLGIPEEASTIRKTLLGQ